MLLFLTVLLFNFLLQFRRERALLESEDRISLQRNSLLYGVPTVCLHVNTRVCAASGCAERMEVYRGQFCCCLPLAVFVRKRPS